MVENLTKTHLCQKANHDLVEALEACGKKMRVLKDRPREVIEQ